MNLGFALNVNSFYSRDYYYCPLFLSLVFMMMDRLLYFSPFYQINDDPAGGKVATFSND
jgi:hypothetical protein